MSPAPPHEYLQPDPHEPRRRPDYFVWLIRCAAATLVDTEFQCRGSAGRGGRKYAQSGRCAGALRLHADDIRILVPSALRPAAISPLSQGGFHLRPRESYATDVHLHGHAAPIRLGGAPSPCGPTLLHELVPPQGDGEWPGRTLLVSAPFAASGGAGSRPRAVLWFWRRTPLLT